MNRGEYVKCFTGNLDGVRTGLVVAKSKKEAAKVAGASLRDFNDHWCQRIPWPEGYFVPGKLYTSCHGQDEWTEGRCPLTEEKD